jgi:hypothetical protein
MAKQEDNKNNFKKVLKGALGVGAAYLAVKNPDGFLQVAGGLAEGALKEREELIKVRGEELAADKAYYRQRADIAYANKTAQYETDFAATNKLDKALSSLVSASASNGASKRDIAMNVLVAKGIIPNTGTKIDDTSGIALQLNTEINKLKDVVGEDGKVTGYTYEGTAVPNRPDYKDYFDSSKIQLAQASIADNSFSTLSQKLFGKDDTGDAALATLQRDMDSGYQEVLESDLSGKSKQYQFKAGEEKETDQDKTPIGTPIISKNSGQTINLNIPAAFPLIYQDDDLLTDEAKSSKASQTAIFNRIESNFKSQTDDQSGAFVQDTFNAIQATLPAASLEIISDYAGSKVLGTKAEGAHLYNRTQTLIMEIAQANYHKAGWETGNDSDNNKGALLQRLEFELPRRIIALDTDNFGLDNPVAGTYIIPSHVLPLYIGLPDKVKSLDGTDVMVDTMSYLQEELNKTLEQFGEDEGKTMAAVASILDAKVAEILYPQEVSEIKTNIPTVSKDGQEYTIDGETDSFKNLQDEISKMDEAQKNNIPSSIMEQYNIWLGTQESSSSVDKASVDNQVQELVPDISKMQLGTVIEKNLVTPEYLNSYTKDVTYASSDEFFAGNNMMLKVGDEVTTKNGIKYESYIDTTTNDQGREISTLKFKPIIIE